MPTVRATITVAVPCAEVFDFVADYRNIPRIQPQFTSVRLVGDTEYGVGATIELHGRFHGIPLRERNRIIAFSAPGRMVSVSEGTITSRSTWELEDVHAEARSTRVTLTVDYKLGDALGGLFRGMGSALWPVFNREIQGMTSEALRRLKECCEGQ